MKLNLRGISYALGASTLLAAPVDAQILVDRLVGSDWVNIGNLPAGSNVDITDTNSDTFRVYVGSPANPSQTIGIVTINSGATATPTLFIGRGFTVPDQFFALPIAGAYDLGGVTWTGGRPRLQARVTNDINSDAIMWHVVRIDAGGIIRGNVTHDGDGVQSAPTLGAVTAHQFYGTGGKKTIRANYGFISLVLADIDLAANVVAEHGSIGLVQAGGSIFGDVIALKGAIDRVIATTYIGPTSYPVRPAKIEARVGINRIESEGTITADIKANANEGNGSLTVLRTSFFGDLVGSLSAQTLIGAGGERALEIDGHLDADLTLTGSFQNQMFFAQSLKPGRTLKIGGELGLAAEIRTPSIQGQVIINGSGQSFLWRGTVCICDLAGGFTLNGPYYTSTSAAIGGGAVGQAPFNLHGTDCTPPNGQVVAFSQFVQPVIVRHYGPVQHSTSGGSGTPIKIEARSLLSGFFFDITSDFKVTMHPGNVLRDISIKESDPVTGFQPGYEYRITPRLTGPDTLRCLMVDGSPTVPAYTYTFILQ